MNRVKIIIITYCEDSYCPMNVPVKALINKDGYVLTAHRLDDGSGCMLDYRASKTTKYRELLHECTTFMGVLR